MKVIEMNRSEATRPTIGREEFIDIETVRRRVAKIKNGWTSDTVRARATEGDRRRRELESLILDLMTDTSDSEESCDIGLHGFSLVG